MKNLENIQSEITQAIERGIDKQFENWIQYWADESFLIDMDDLSDYLWNEDDKYQDLIQQAMRDRLENLFVGIFHYTNMDFEIFMEKFFESDKFIWQEQKMIQEFVDLDEIARELENEYYTDQENDQAFKREVNSTYL